MWHFFVAGREIDGLVGPKGGLEWNSRNGMDSGATVAFPRTASSKREETKKVPTFSVGKVKRLSRIC